MHSEYLSRASSSPPSKVCPSEDFVDAIGISSWTLARDVDRSSNTVLKRPYSTDNEERKIEKYSWTSVK